MKISTTFSGRKSPHFLSPKELVPLFTKNNPIEILVNSYLLLDGRVIALNVYVENWHFLSTENENENKNHRP
jgi:hypothetical protein